MNSIRKTLQLNDQELAEGTSISASWHNDYNDTAYIYIGGLETKLTEMDIATVFSQFGNPTHVKLSRDPKTGKSRGFAWLKYADQRSTVLAVDNFNGVELLGRTVRVDHTYYESRDEEADQKEVDMLAKARDLKVRGPEKDSEKDRGERSERRESRDSRRSRDDRSSRDYSSPRDSRDRSPDRERRSHRSSRRDDEKSSSRRSRDDDRDERKSRDSDRNGEKSRENDRESRDSGRRKDDDRDEKRDEGSRRSQDDDRSSRRSRDDDRSSRRSRDDRSSRRSRRDRDDSRERSHRSKRSRRDRSRDEDKDKSRDEKPRDTGKPIVKPAAPQDPDLVDPMAAYFAGKKE